MKAQSLSNNSVIVSDCDTEVSLGIGGIYAQLLVGTTVGGVVGGTVALGVMYAQFAALTEMVNKEPPAIIINNTITTLALMVVMRHLNIIGYESH